MRSLIDTNSAFVPLVACAALWAQRSGMPPKMVLRRVCEWAMVGAFPDKAFVDPGGLTIEPFDIYMAARVLTEGNPLFSTISLGGWTLSGRSYDPVLLEKVQLSVGDVLRFCDQLNVYPPDPLLTRFQRFEMRFVLRKALVPPPCPHADAHAVQHMKRSSATGSVNRLRDILEGIKGNRRVRSPYVRVVTEPFHAEEWSKIWCDELAETQATVQAHGDETHAKALEDLVAQWDAFLRFETMACASISVAPTGPDVRVRLSTSSTSVTVDGTKLQLPEKPFRLLLALARRAERDDNFVSHQALADQLWGSSAHQVSRHLRDVVRDLRGHLTSAGLDQAKVQQLVQTGPTQGYRLNVPRDQIRIEE
ncbi:winged helix-turn-helix domain-containing protein [Salinarimonas soli]|uniref:OmpR/PhoB-type domain-containing protein n=1 Tax=Salinarimonas soli TaxID=1638099 RepID=A0A5B2VDE2_9HYPH|nr:winged helix-turn-helix domain-containing protein [Salinarimonas soli]KAA2237081.1 hypothetical protein F0L46_11500 [Salinarimonas soli]